MNPQPLADTAPALFFAVDTLARFASSLQILAFFVLLLPLSFALGKRLGMPGSSVRLKPWALVILCVCLLVFAGVAAVLVVHPVLMVDLDRHFLVTLAQNQVAWTNITFAAITRLADTVTLTLLTTGVALALVLSALRKVRTLRWYAHRQGVLALGWVLAVVGNTMLNPALKAIFHRARPLHENVTVFAQGLSFPSGHTSGAVVAYGMLAFVLIRWLQNREKCMADSAAIAAVQPFDSEAARGDWWRQNSWKSRYGTGKKADWSFMLVYLALLIAWNVGWSRLVLQVHFLSDVLAGFVSGIAWLTVSILTTDALLRRWGAMPLPPPLQPVRDES